MEKQFLVSIFLLFSVGVYGQGDFYTKFFTLRDARISVGIGYEGVFAYDNDETGSYSVIYRQLVGKPDYEVDSQNFKTYVGWGVAFDLYAPTSLLGIYTEVNYFESGFEFRQNDKSTGDVFNMNILEIPFLLKIRPGKFDSPKRFYLMAGVSYNIPMDVNYTADGVSGNDIDILQKYWGLSGIVGYEAIGEGSFPYTSQLKAFRTTIFSRINYRFQTPFNTSYPAPITSFISNEELSFNDFMISFGIRLFYRFKA